MPQSDEQQAKKQVTDEARLEREKASGNKLWSAYISEAQSYDQGLIDGWRSEMDGLLIFAGLFSGVVTTFIIDSYKTLNPDSGGQTVELLSQTVTLLGQISQQLANMNNGTAVQDALPPATAFSPPTSSLVCNALWFTSLALSLSSALVATLVKQWAQEYQHRTSMFSSPSVRARVYMYLYHGLQRFNMHAVVGVPPLLLHAALVLFFAGLVAFLVPVNVIITGISSALLLSFVSVYGTFTVLPLFCFDSPFQTPLTRILWSLNQSLGSILRTYVRRAVVATDPEAHTGPSVPVDTSLQTQSMVKAMTSAALHPTVETETRALAWAMRSLSNDLEFEPFVEGLAQVLWDFDSGVPCSVYQAHFKILLSDPEICLYQRLADFMAGSNSYLLEPTARVRRQLSVLRAIWAICAFSLHTGSPLECPLGEANVDHALLGSKFVTSPDVQSHVLAVHALIRLNVIESKSRQRTLEHPDMQTGDSDRDLRAEMEQQLQVEKDQTYVQYLVALSKSPASFQREVTHLLFHRSQILVARADADFILRVALEELIKSGSDETVYNVVFAARHLISVIADTSAYPLMAGISGLAQFLVRHPCLTAYDPESNSQPGPKSNYTRFLCYYLCLHLKWPRDFEASAYSLQLIYRHFLNAAEPARYPADLDTHLSVLRALRNSGTQAADIHTHRLVAMTQYAVLACVSPDLSESGQLSESDDLLESAELLSILNDDYETWFRALIGFDNEKWMERGSTHDAHYLIHSCVRVGVVTTFLEQCAQKSDQTERKLDFETLDMIHALSRIRQLLPSEIQL
ncbi:unnamed protein product [Mycena citricolor]|uniref:DUF6535 domain-containing protein n=1 Tax=Mycena citricolor TaxID=2018698 RepID=A0AAD2JV13_9AGAR|nr:unnamed protein product [Mycena citricolor]